MVRIAVACRSYATDLCLDPAPPGMEELLAYTSDFADEMDSGLLY